MMVRVGVAGLMLLFSASGAIGSDNKVGKAAAAVRLYDDALKPVGTVAAGAAWEGKPILADSHPESVQFVKIRYDGPATPEVASGRDYWVRKSSVVPRASCTTTTVAASERDTRAGPNGAGSFCAAAPKP
jgi:hypothetical protein